jgi:hypothetical protein
MNEQESFLISIHVFPRQFPAKLEFYLRSSAQICGKAFPDP